VGEWILVWSLYCTAYNEAECRYAHKSYDTFGECVEVLAEKDHEMMDYYHVIFCTKRDYFIKLRKQDDKYYYNAPKRNITIK